MSVNEVKDFIFEKYYKQIGFYKKDSYYSMEGLNKKGLLLIANKLIKNIPDLRNAKGHYKLFIKQSEIITYQPRSFQNPNLVNIRLIITEHPKTSHKLFKTTRL